MPDMGPRLSIGLSRLPNCCSNCSNDWLAEKNPQLIFSSVFYFFVLLMVTEIRTVWKRKSLYWALSLVDLLISSIKINSKQTHKHKISSVQTFSETLYKSTSCGSSWRLNSTQRTVSCFVCLLKLWWEKQLADIVRLSNVKFMEN